MFSTRAAQEWGGTFTIPEEAQEKDLQLLRAHGGDLAAMCRTRHSEMNEDRLSVSRIHSTFGPDGKLIPTFPMVDFHRLLDFAIHGITVHRPLSFIASPIPPTFRTKYLAVAPTVHKLLFKQHAAGTVVFLPLSDVAHIPNLHLSPQHWTEKKGKPEGRTLGDLSNTDTTGVSPLNGCLGEDKEELRQRVNQYWGEIFHPTLDQLIRMILRMAMQHSWDSLTMWKKDLNAAFNLLWYRPEDVSLLGFPLANGLVVFHLGGMFGWLGMPAAFQVITRSLKVASNHHIQGECDWYVDDAMGIASSVSVAHSDMATVNDIARGLLGPTAIADKDECGRRQEWIGWEIDLDHRLVTISRRNFLKMCHAFFSFNLSDPISVHHVEKMASYASRCSQLSRQMRPYTRALHVATTRYFNHNARLRLPLLARCDVSLWRAFLAAIRFDEQRIARPLVSFRERNASFVIEYDASLSMMAVGVSHLLANQERQLIAYTSLHSPFPPTTEARKQNTFEFLAVVVGLLLSKLLHLRDFAYELHGDSVSSLTWTEKNRAASELARRANIALTLISVDIGAFVTDTTHVPGVLNVVYDGLSRGKTGSEVGLDPAKQVFLTSDHTITKIITLCDPDQDLSSVSEHLELSGKILDLLHNGFT